MSSCMPEILYMCACYTVHKALDRRWYQPTLALMPKTRQQTYQHTHTHITADYLKFILK
jgi:hypothetical protein